MILQKIIQGSYLENLQSISHNSLVLSLKTKEKNKVFLLLDFYNSKRPKLISSKGDIDLKLNSFLQIARKYLKGKKLQFFYENKQETLFLFEFFSSSFLEPNILALSLKADKSRLSLLKKHKKLPDVYNKYVDMKFFKAEVFESYAEWSVFGFRTKKSLFLKTDEYFTCLLKDNVFFKRDSEITKPSALKIKIPVYTRRKISRHLKFLKKRIERQKGDLPSLESLQCEENKLLNLQKHLYLWPQKNSRWLVPSELQLNYGLESEYAIEGKLSPGEYLANQFKKLKKLKKRYSMLSMRLQDSKKSLISFEEKLDALLREVDETLFESKLEDFLNLHKLNVFQKNKLSKLSVLKHQENSLYYEHYSVHGEFIRVSKNAQKADEMLKLIPGNHFWFHVYNVPGSHVWLEQKRSELKEKSLKEAAILALYYSKLSRSFSGDVQYTQRMNVKKKNKLPPGKVLVNKYKTVYVKYTEDELNLILSRTQNV